MSHYLESGNLLWIRFPTLPAGEKQSLRMYFNNPNAVSTSNPTLTFYLYDSFTTLGLWWSQVGSTLNYTITPGGLRLNNGTVFCQVPFWPDQRYMEAKVRWYSPPSGAQRSAGFACQDANKNGAAMILNSDNFIYTMVRNDTSYGAAGPALPANSDGQLLTMRVTGDGHTIYSKINNYNEMSVGHYSGDKQWRIFLGAETLGVTSPNSDSVDLLVEYVRIRSSAYVASTNLLWEHGIHIGPCMRSNCDYCPDGSTDECAACKPGYTLEAGNCYPTTRCPYPFVAHGRWLSCDTNFNGLCGPFECEDGYVSSGSTDGFRCSAGIWSMGPPRCDPISCEAPQVTSAVLRPGTLFTLGSIATWSCPSSQMLQGASYARCQADERWSMPAPICVPRPSIPNQDCDGMMDCSGQCNGNAFFDRCGVCSGGNTSRVPNEDMDACGVCFGNNAAMDACGVCYGMNVSMDHCGVCFGGDKSCVGCDGVPFSNVKRDSCGVCGGNNSTCMGCDGVPLPAGGKVYDKCGVCGGPNMDRCMRLRGCDNNVGSTFNFDCTGLCNGKAFLDQCGRCVPVNSTNTAPCGCWNQCGACEAGTARDACGVCGGDNSTCLGCDGVPIPLGGKVYDRCRVCGGDNSSCNVGCDGSTDPTFSRHFDVLGYCQGYNTLDDCGYCIGDDGQAACHNRDDCGVCFGGNAAKDQCGVCFGNNAGLNECGLCPGNVTGKDACGVCFGGNRDLDQCGICFGNSTTCAGCDGMPNSDKRWNSCGRCVSINDDDGDYFGCTGPDAIKVQPGGGPDHDITAFWTQIMSVAVPALIVLVILTLAFSFVYRARKRRGNALQQFETGTQIITTGLSPSGNVTLVSLDAPHLGLLAGEVPGWTIDEAIDAAREVIFHRAVQHNAYIVTEHDCTFLLAFQHADEAAAFCVETTLSLHLAAWPEDLLSTNYCTPVYDVDGICLLHRGLQLRMAIGTGRAERIVQPQTSRVAYDGPVLWMTRVLLEKGVGGDILFTEDSYHALHVFANVPANRCSARNVGSLELLEGRGIVDIFKLEPVATPGDLSLAPQPIKPQKRKSKRASRKIKTDSQLDSARSSSMSGDEGPSRRAGRISRAGSVVSIPSPKADGPRSGRSSERSSGGASSDGSSGPPMAFNDIAVSLPTGHSREGSIDVPMEAEQRLFQAYAEHAAFRPDQALAIAASIAEKQYHTP